MALLGLFIEFAPRASGSGVQISLAQWSGRRFTLCASDADRGPGERIQIDFFVDGQLYDRLHVPNTIPASCAQREFAPFGPRVGGHRVEPWLVDEPGGAPVALPSTLLEEDCTAFAGTNAHTWCVSTSPNGVPEYYGIRQAITVPLIADFAWAGVNLGYGGLIQQLYSVDRSYNLLDEHAGGAMGLALWGVAQPSFGPLAPCNWPPPPPEGSGPPMNVMHVLFPQGPNCDYGVWAQAVGLEVNRGALTGLLSYLLDTEHHGRRLTLSNFAMGQWVFNRGEYLEIVYAYRNLSAWDFGAMDQEIPALHLNRGVNREFAWSRNEAPGYGYRAVAESESWATRLVTPGVSPFSGPGTENWNGRWVTVCSAGRIHCLTVAPAAPPSSTGIHMANLRANTDRIDTPSGPTSSNQVSLLGRFPIPRSDAIRTHTVYVFPYSVIQPLPSGQTVLQRISTLQRW
jgi:hypothetical protein